MMQLQRGVDRAGTMSRAVRTKPSRAGILAALAAALCLAGAAAAQTKPLSPYEQLSEDQLIKRLSLLGMVELLEAMEREVPEADKSMKALATRGRIGVGIANALSDPDGRNQELDKAIPLLRQAVKMADRKTALVPAEQLVVFEYTRDLIVALGRLRVENPHVLRLRHLQGGEIDRRVVDKHTKEAVELIDFLKEDINEYLQKLRGDMDLWMRYGPRAEDLQREVMYNAAWVRLHRALVLDKGGERDQLCRDIIAEMKPFSQDPEFGVMYQAIYVTGIAYRLLGQYDKADTILGKAAVPENTSKDIRQRAWFERARNRIEEGDTAKAEKAIKDFEFGSETIWGPGHRPMVDVGVVFLRNYLYGLLAAKEKDNAKAKALREKAQDVLLSFVEKYADRPDLVKAFLDIIATKFAGVEDLADASAVVLLARAYTKVDAKDPAVKAEAEQLLKKVLQHPDMKNARVAKSIEPGVLWELAFLMNRARRNSEAAACFVLLARKYPENRLAPRSATFAVVSLNEVFKEFREKGKPIATNLRLEFIRALDALLGKWSDQEGATKWNFDLATQCQVLAATNQSPVVKLYWQTGAIAAFEKVPSELVEYTEAQHSALTLRSDVVLKRKQLADRLEPGNERTLSDLGNLAQQLLTSESVELPGVTSPAGPTTAPAEAGETSAGAELVGMDARAETLRKELVERLKVYSDPQALTDRLQKYAVDAGKEAGKVAQQAAAATGNEKEDLTNLALQLKDWAAEADYQAAEIKYEMVAAGKKDPAERKKIEEQALADLRGLDKKWPGTAVLRRATEFEIRKLVERGDTPKAIEKIQAFKKDYPEQAQQLIQLVVRQIQLRVDELDRQLRDARTTSEAEATKAEMRKYQLAYAGFAQDLYKPVEGLPISLDELDRSIRLVEALEKKRDFDGVLAEAKKFADLAAKSKAPVEEIKGAKVLGEQIADSERSGADKAALLPNLAGALINALKDLRDVVLERYSRVQMYTDSLIQKGRAEALRNETLEAKAAFQMSLQLFQQAAKVDDARRQVEADLLDARYLPRVEQAKKTDTMEAVRRMMEALKAEMVAAGRDPNQSGDLGTLQYAYDYLRKASSREEEKQRLPRAVDLLTRAWQNFLAGLKFHLIVDHRNIIGQARAHRGLGQFPEAMKFYRQYTDGVPESSEFHWPAQLERCRCHLEGFRGNKEAMKNLVIHINMLQLKDKTMGGLGTEFEAIKREAEQEMKKAK